MARMGLTTSTSFRRAVLQQTGVSVCSRAALRPPPAGEREHYVRFAYSGIDTPRSSRARRLKAYGELTGAGRAT